MSANEMPGLDTPICMTYRNYRGEIAERCIIPDRVRFGSTDWHPEPGWLLHAFDTDKGAFRDFALADCQFAALTPAPQPSETVTEAQIDAIAVVLSKRIYKQTEGEWQPSIRQADELARVALRALKGSGDEVF